ncbi:MAG: wax ester/triacylglycerol synthase family O-acyltransferase [Pseudomonadota bacterium]
MAKKLGDLIKEWSPEQLTGLDALFAAAETPRTPMHIGGCAIYDPSTAPGGAVRFKDILQFVEDRLHRTQTFRQKLKHAPLGLDNPYWVDDPDFDIEFHIRHIALPQPGDWRQLCIQVARLHARSLDMSKPLWEFTVIEGLDNIPGVPKGSYAIVSKVHHCAVDGVSGVEISQALHTLEAEDDVASEAHDPWTPGRTPGAIELLARANFNNAVKPFHAMNVARKLAPGAWKYAAGVTRGDFRLLGTKVPRTRFNATVSGHRVFEGVTFDLADVKKIRGRIPGVTVNDVMLAVVGGGLRRYLKSKDELPADSLIAMAPISVRAKGEKSALGNQVSALSVPLGTHVADPLARLHFTHNEATSQKEMANAVGARDLADASKLAPATLSGVSARLYSRLGLANRLSPMFNTVVTNVPGPQAPLYMAGARMVASYGTGPVMDSMGLFHAVTSYCGEIVITVTACRDMLPDPAFYAECLQASFDELLDAASEPRAPKKRKKAATADASPLSEQPIDIQIETAVAAGAADDLTVIRGLGRALAARLAAAGIGTLRDIATLSPEAAAALDQDLALRGRIFRDDWIGQAAAILANGRAPADAAASVH